MAHHQEKLISKHLPSQALQDIEMKHPAKENTFSLTHQPRVSEAELSSSSGNKVC